MGASASIIPEHSMSQHELSDAVRSIGEAYAPVANSLLEMGVDEKYLMENNLDEVLDDLHVTERMRPPLRRFLLLRAPGRAVAAVVTEKKESADAPAADAAGASSAHEPVHAVGADTASRRKIFRSAVGGIAPWGLGDDDTIAWLESELQRGWSSSDWTAPLKALRGLDGAGLVELCEPKASPPWVKLTKGVDGTRLTKQGAKAGQVGNLNALLNKHGIGYYALLYESCDRRCPLMDLIWSGKLGEGAFGQVHRVKNKYRSSAERDVLSAVKLIKVDDEAKLDSASNEMKHQMRAAASTEFVVDVRNWGQIGDEYLFIEMELCAGGDVRKLLDASDPPRSGIADGALRWKLYGQICSGMSAIHAAGLIHMDLKPENGATPGPVWFFLRVRARTIEDRL